MNSRKAEPTATHDVCRTIADLKWLRADCRLLSIRSVPGKTREALLAIQAIVKRVTSMVAAEQEGATDGSVFFHIIGKRFSYKPRQGNFIDVSLLFLKCNSTYVSRWLETLQHYLEDSVNQANFQLVISSEILERSYESIQAELQIDKSSGEICLDFYTPVPFKPADKRRRTHVSAEQLVALFEQRFHKLFGREITYEPGEDDFIILHQYWKYTEIAHSSLSQAGETHYIKGCFGPLYIKGSFKNFLPFLVLGSELHTGSKISYSQGYYAIKEPSPPYFARFFPNKRALTTAVEAVRDRYDQGLHKPTQDAEPIRDDAGLAERLFFELTRDQYTPAPSTAFVIKKKDGGERMVEQLSDVDLIVHHYLLKTIEDPFDRLFEEGSVGYRKGISRERAAEMIQAAIAEGYQYVVESDISDFFPSVNLDQLSLLLEKYIPEQDTLIKSILNKCVRCGYVLNGVHYQRTRGLAQGSPLSPILANLYLDAFDEHLTSLNIKIIRYADDFIILTRTREEAERMIAEAELFLGGLGLHIKPEKTAIKAIAESFQFLGITFTRTDVEIVPERELKRLKKPLYITEPYLFLSLNGEAVSVLKNGVIQETIPLRRLSEIIVLEKVGLSSSLLKQLVQANIPLTLTLGSGYYITTIKPDSRYYYNFVYEHGRKYGQLSEAEVLAVAKEIAATKLHNSASLFQQKYIHGNNRLISDLQEAVKQLNQASDFHEVRGIEGAAAHKVYVGLNTLIDDPDFHIRRRDRTKPDPINSLLNFGYYLLYARINATVRAVGLNPYLGFLHAPEDSYESLVADLQELFRARIDRFLIRLINLRIIRKDDFTRTERGFYLLPDAKRRFLHHFELEANKSSGKHSMSLLDWLYYQVIVLKKWVHEEGSLTFYRWEV